jgi:CRP-like cAMP-binding protein
LHKDEVVFLQSAVADAVFYIQKGKEAVVAILGPGAFFGEGCLIGQPLQCWRQADRIVQCIDRARLSLATSAHLVHGVHTVAPQTERMKSALDWDSIAALPRTYHPWQSLSAAAFPQYFTPTSPAPSA